MAMPPGTVVVPDKMQFPAANGAAGGPAGGGAAGGNEMVQQQHLAHRHQWFALDERDGFISWLRGEFAAANAMIDSLCHHLRTVGEPGEYDAVIGSIQQRRCNWNPVLHMQQYFSIADVIFTLQQVASRRQQQQHHHQQLPHPRYYHDQPKLGGKEYRRSNSTGFNKGNRGGEVVKEVAHPNVENHNADGNSVVIVGVEKVDETTSVISVEKSDEKVSTHTEDEKEAIVNLTAHGQTQSSDDSEGNTNTYSEPGAVAVNDQASDNGLSPSLTGCAEDDSLSSQDDKEKPNLKITPRSFTGPEIIEGKTVNVVEGLRLYDHFLNDSEVSCLVSLVNDYRVAGRKGHCQGQTYVVSKTPTRGHGRELIQFGVPIIDVHMDDDNSSGAFKERKVESIPASLQDVIDRLVSMHLVPVKPDSCVIDIYYEGDYSQPYLWPSYYGKSVSTLFLTDCNMTFGRVILNEHPGDYKGALKLALGPGSLLIMEGKSLEFARHALSAIRKQRILITFIKSQLKKFALGDGGPRLAAAPHSHWGPQQNRSPNHIRHPIPSRSHSHYAPIPATGVLPAQPIRPVPAPNGVQPLFVTAPVAAPMPFPASVTLPPASTGWAAGPPRHPASRLPVPAPGTGVFLPPSGPGSGHASSSPIHAPTDANFPSETHVHHAKENGSMKSNHSNNSSPREKHDGKAQKHDCNGASREGEKTADH